MFLFEIEYWLRISLLKYASKAVYCSEFRLSAARAIIYSCLFTWNWFHSTQIDRSHEQIAVYRLISRFSIDNHKKMSEQWKKIAHTEEHNTMGLIWKKLKVPVEYMLLACHLALYSQWNEQMIKSGNELSPEFPQNHNVFSIQSLVISHLN